MPNKQKPRENDTSAADRRRPLKEKEGRKERGKLHRTYEDAKKREAGRTHGAYALTFALWSNHPTWCVGD
jgi:hypothetical protein